MAILEELVLPHQTIFGDNAEPKQSIYEESETPQYMVGTQLIMPDGRTFRYAKAGGTALSKALMCSGGAHEDKVLQEVLGSGLDWAVGDTQVTMTVTTGATFVENEYANGYVYANKVNEVGDIYRILANKVQSTDTKMDLLLASPVRNAIAAATELTLCKSVYRDVVVFATTPVNAAAGVPLIDVTADYYCWLQTGGPCPIIKDAGDTIVLGAPVGAPGTAAAAGKVGLLADDGTGSIWGHCMQIAGGDDEIALVKLMLEA